MVASPSVKVSTRTPTRTAGTEQKYLARALWFEEFAARQLDKLTVDPLEVAQVAIERKPLWTANTWNQTKAALIYRYESMKTSIAIQAVTLLKNTSRDGTIKKSNKTSALRKKTIRDDELMLVCQKVGETKSQYANILKKWLLLGAVTGLRPHEWCQAQVIQEEDATIAQSSLFPVKLYLKVLNAKNSNGRSHGQFRHLDLSEYPAHLIEQIKEFSEDMAEALKTGEYKTIYLGCQQLLHRVNTKLNHPSERRIQIYSARHKFSSEAKNKYTLLEVAALMGHATDKTASAHYGKRNQSTSGPNNKTLVKPIDNEVARVRKVQMEMSEHAQLKYRKIQKAKSQFAIMRRTLSMS